MDCCPCGTEMHRVHKVTEKGSVTCVGFYCPRCKVLDKAIGRERKFPISYKP